MAPQVHTHTEPKAVLSTTGPPELNLKCSLADQSVFYINERGKETNQGQLTVTPGKVVYAEKKNLQRGGKHVKREAASLYAFCTRPGSSARIDAAI